MINVCGYVEYTSKDSTDTGLLFALAAFVYRNHDPPNAFLAHGYEREQELCSSIVGYCESCVMQITTRMRMLESRGELRAPFGTSGKYRRPIEYASSTLNSLFPIFFYFSNRMTSDWNDDLERIDERRARCSMENFDISRNMLRSIFD